MLIPLRTRFEKLADPIDIGFGLDIRFFSFRQPPEDIKTIILSQPPEAVFSAALAAAKNMGWEIVASVPAEGHIEATATTPFVAFKDDVVIRVRAGQAGTLVDVRSKSRIGKGDMGVNAARIRAYTAELTGIK